MHLGAREADAIELPLEAAAVLRQTRRDERPARAARAFVRGRLADIDAELGEHAADPPRSQLKILLERVERRRLALLDSIERGLQAGYDPADAARAFGEQAVARIERGIAVGGHEEGALVVERGRLERDRARLATTRRPDRAGEVTEAAERARARLQRCLPAQDLV